jgi:hypothetical protein
VFEMCENNNYNNYNERFFWHEGEIHFSKTKYPVTQQDIDHANKVIDKIIKKYYNL